MTLAIALFAAIMTESTGTFADAPPFAAVEISSPYIPYGTYTDGVGGTEYLRVGTNFVGAVASMIDGFWERVALPYGWLPPAISTDCPELAYPLREGCRDTRRILSTAINDDGYSTNRSTGIRIQLEKALADGYVAAGYHYPSPGVTVWYTNAVHAGVAGSATDGYVDPNGVRYRYGGRDPVVWSSRKAEEVFVPAEIPINTEWSGQLPFKAADSNIWRSVFPVYSAYEFDPHFFPTNDEELIAHTFYYYRPHLQRWMRADHVDDIWGSDVWGGQNDGAGYDLYNALYSIPVATNALMESVLKVDPGWKYEVPPVETGSYWTVSGPLGNFRLSEYHEEYQTWDNPYPTNYYLMLSFYDYEGEYSLNIYDSTSADPTEAVFWGFCAGTEDSDDLNFDGYDAQRTRLISNQDDFAHWRNMTTRIDWKRFGIVAQLERQMEITYRAREREDYLPLWEFFVKAHRYYAGTLPLHVSISNEEVSAYVVGHEPSLSLSYASWTLTGTGQEAQTNRLSSSYPTARGICNLDGAVIRTSSAPYLLHGDLSIRDDLIFEGIADAIAVSVVPLPTGTKQIRADLNIAQSGMAVSTIFVWFGLNDVRSFPVSLSPFGFLVVPDIETSATFDLLRTDSKIARDITTLANNATEEYKLMGHDPPAAYPDEMTPAAISNLETRLWQDGYLASITLPTIEVRLAASNDYWAGMLDAEPAMPYIGNPGDSHTQTRAFRYQCAVADSSDLRDFRGDRLLSLRDLDAEVKSHFSDFAGRAITTELAGRAAFNAQEIAAFENAINNTDAVVSLSKNLNAYHEIWAEGLFDFDNGWQEGDTLTLFTVNPNMVTNSFQIVYSTTNFTSHAFGSWTVVVDAQASPAITNSGVRVDGHQNQMMKTLWRFKNLRDPNL